MEFGRVSDVMTREVVAVAPDTGVETAARLFTTQRISGAPVVSAKGRPVGVVTLADLVDPDRDVTNKKGFSHFYTVAGGEAFEVGDGAETNSGQVADVMSPFVLSIKSSASLAEAARVMVGDGVHRLLVLEGTELVGIVTSTDLLRGFASVSH